MSKGTGAGASLTFVTSGTTLGVTTINHSGIARESIETTELATTGGKEFTPGDLYDPGEIAISWSYDPDVQPPYTAVAEVMRITYPLQTGQSSAAKVEASGFITSWDEPELAQDSYMTASLTIKLSGDLTYTASA